MERQKILDELADIQRRIAEYLEILGSDKVLRDVIIKELKEVQKEFGDERRTEIIEDAGEIRLEDLVPVEDVAVTVTRDGYLKRTAGGYLPPPDARRQGPHRHGHAHGGLRRAPDRRLHAQLPADLHQQGARLLAQDLRDPRRRHGRQGQAHLEPDQPAAGRKREGLPGGEGVRARTSTS